MPSIPTQTGAFFLFAVIAAPAAASQATPPQDPPQTSVTVTGTRPAAPVELARGPDIRGIISGRNADKVKVTADDGTSTVIAITEATSIKTEGLFGGGLFSGRSKQGAAALRNGLPVTVRTLQSGDGLVASQIVFRNSDLRVANMIDSGTAQKFEEQTAATAALRGRLGDIDKYNVKKTVNVYFDTGKAILSGQARAELCTTASEADKVDNALMLVVGYTDSVGSQENNQRLSERRAASVINHLQQACGWKPYRMLTPTGLAEADPLASNDTEEGKAQNRRVSVNILVSKGVDGL
ncbi:OmpA family protein [Sphingomonas sp.]|uniref:OmpA family protein n=1 Tax=Sphingomonas sp. TaxID=28214 RepID=UPI001E03605D|nr:OmpA family protein [Sphingomonas sp.]MBX9797759.1 OmpA family protein [Sphingomonas sp.]